MTDWLIEVKERQEELLTDLYSLLKIPSVREDDKTTKETPVGPGPLEALEKFLEMGAKDGFKTQQYGPWAGHIEFGEGEELFGILGHVDVVPVGTGWKTNPFDPVIQDDKIYARGASDNKGPMVGAYFAMKLLKEQGFVPNKRIRLIIGTDEESDWQCMDYYFAHAEMPDFGFSPDANFPVINGEKGNITVSLRVNDDSTTPGQAELISFQSGLRVNMVPQDAKAIVEADFDETIEAAYKDYLVEHDLTGELSYHQERYVFQLVGKSAHGAMPDKGVNAGTYLAQFLNKHFKFNQAKANMFVQLLGNDLHLATDGAKVNLAATDKAMGALTMNVGLMHYHNANNNQILANIRYPQGVTAKWMDQQLQAALSNDRIEIQWDLDGEKVPHYIPEDNPIVKTLLDVYHKHTGLEAHGISIGGGTYARLIPQGVAFGALFPYSEDTMHQANEFITIDDLLRATAIYAESIYRLAK